MTHRKTRSLKQSHLLSGLYNRHPSAAVVTRKGMKSKALKCLPRVMSNTRSLFIDAPATSGGPHCYCAHPTVTTHAGRSRARPSSPQPFRVRTAQKSIPLHLPVLRNGVLGLDCFYFPKAKPFDDTAVLLHFRRIFNLAFGFLTLELE